MGAWARHLEMLLGALRSGKLNNALTLAFQDHRLFAALQAHSAAWVGEVGAGKHPHSAHQDLAVADFVSRLRGKAEELACFALLNSTVWTDPRT